MWIQVACCAALSVVTIAVLDSWNPPTKTLKKSPTVAKNMKSGHQDKRDSCFNTRRHIRILDIETLDEADVPVKLK